MNDNQAADRKFPLRRRTAGAAAAVGAALLAVGIGALPAAGADTSAASRSATALTAAAAAAPGLGSAALMQSDDFFQQGLTPVGATVNLTGKQALSACSGEETMRALTKGKAAAYADVTWAFDTNRTSLTESVADGSTDTSAASYEKQLNKMVRSCQDEPQGHWYYGKGHALTVKAGNGSWYPAFNGAGKVAGGIAVIRSGHRFGIVELSGQPSDDPGYMEGITAGAVNRLAH
ncbi:hypothetical protein GCM10022403_036520 [Streptomyces coacervatus]|uniref:Uncharacterized protein n=1 Tax=Streptomyces coacervatus TaxID=647381 RepID=A0ABP7HR50_9ACTN|nr:hypothetical protein [Streptomyces coacervatus]MDF2270925.1 hypothetical protein [Streptomyces coacervatus]